MPRDLHRGLEPGRHPRRRGRRSPTGGFGLVDDGAVRAVPGISIAAPTPVSTTTCRARADHRQGRRPPRDVYSWAASCIRADRGPPFEGSSIEDILKAAHLQGKVPVPSDLVRSVPADSMPSWRAALAKDPLDRYGSATALANDLLLNVAPGQAQAAEHPSADRSVPARALPPEPGPRISPSTRVPPPRSSGRSGPGRMPSAPAGGCRHRRQRAQCGRRGIGRSPRAR